MLCERALSAVPQAGPVSETSSHLVVLRDIVKPGMQVLEVGSGFYSTAFFLGADLDVLVSLESDEEWLREVAEKFGDEHAWVLIYTGGNVEEPFIPHLPLFDVALVDGCQNGRVSATERLFREGVRDIVVHDWNGMAHYGYDKMTLPEEYSLRVDRTTLATTAHFHRYKAVD